MKNRYLIIGIILLCVTALLVVVLPPLVEQCRKGHWVIYQLPEFDFSNSATRAEFSDWIESASFEPSNVLYGSHPIDYDLCYLPWTDTVWDELQRHATDTFNVRLNTHSYENHYLRKDGFPNSAKGFCKINGHTIYLYDDYTVENMFVFKKKRGYLCKYIRDQHGLYEWNDETVHVGYFNEHLRTIDARDLFFYDLPFLFYDTVRFSDKSVFQEAIDRDSFAIRSCGPCLLLSASDSCTYEATKNNVRQIFVSHLSSHALEAMTADTRISIQCRVDSTGNTRFQNNSTSDIKDEVDSICAHHIQFVPAFERGKTVNSIKIFQFSKGDLINMKQPR